MLLRLVRRRLPWFAPVMCARVRRIERCLMFSRWFRVTSLVIVLLRVVLIIGMRMCLLMSVGVSLILVIRRCLLNLCVRVG